MSATTRVAGFQTAPQIDGASHARAILLFRWIFLVAMAAFVLAGMLGELGVKTARVTASADGYEVTVAYPLRARPGLAVHWELRVRRAGGFDGPIVVTTPTGYFAVFDFNNLYPVPSKQTASGDLQIMEFDPPPGDTLTVLFDGRVEPARQNGASAVTSVMEGGRRVVSVTYRTTILP